MAQSADASLAGQVTDPSGGAVAEARVAVMHAATALTRTTETNRNGYYVVPALPPGEYEIEVQRAGFKKLRRGGVQLYVGEQARADARLEIGDIAEEITVTAEAEPLEVESAAVGLVIPNHYITNLPLDGRNFLELALLSPGTTPSAQGSAGSERGRFAFQANGARETANAYMYDGVYAIDPVLNSFTLTPSVEAVREFRLRGSNSDASFGRNSGGQVAVVLKQGENHFHGSVYEFFRNDIFDARNFFTVPDQPAPKLRRNQYGFAVGGPIRRNSTFFFADFEGLNERRAITRTTSVPTEAELSGDFSRSVLPAPIDFFTGQPYANGRLPFMHPIGAAVAGLYPSANRSVPGQNFVGSPTANDRNAKFDVRIDQSVGREGTLSGRYSFGDRDRYEPYAAASFSSVPGYGNDVLERGQNLMLGESHTFGLRWINEFRFGYNRVESATFQENLGTSINRTVGLPDFAKRERDLGLTFITVTGLSPLGDEYNNPQDSTVNTYQLLDTVSYAQGDHLVQFGFEQRWLQQNAFRDIQARGLINFTNFAYTQNALADLLLGLPTLTGGAVSDNPQALRSSSTNLFVHDSWRLRPDLTLTWGVRYEYNVPAYDAEDRATVFDPRTFSFAALGSGQVPRGGYESDKNNFAPRVGLAWSPFGTRKTVLRAGYGVYYNTSPLAPGQGIYFNPPYFNLQLYFPSAQAPISIENPWPAGQVAPVPPTGFGYDPALRTTYAQQWNFGTEADLGHGVIVEAGYFGTKGTKLLGARDINQPDASPRMPNLRPLVFYSDLNLTEASFNSIYHSLQTKLQCRLQSGLTGLFSYTWSKSIDNASSYFPSAGDANYPQDSNNVAAERGLSGFDLRHRFSGSFVYELPFGKGKRMAGNLQGWQGAVVSGWQLNSIITLQTGQPFTVALPGEFDNSNTGRAFLGFGAGDRPNVTGNPVLTNPDPQAWFDTAAFALPAFGSFGNAGRNVLSGPPLRTFHLSMLKDTAVTETVKLQLRAEFFNLFNTPNFDQPNIFFGTPGFGRILSARDGREVQFGLKLLF